MKLWKLMLAALVACLLFVTAAPATAGTTLDPAVLKATDACKDEVLKLNARKGKPMSVRQARKLDLNDKLKFPNQPEPITAPGGIWATCLRLNNPVTAVVYQDTLESRVNGLETFEVGYVTKDKPKIDSQIAALQRENRRLHDRIKRDEMLAIGAFLVLLVLIGGGFGFLFRAIRKVRASPRPQPTQTPEPEPRADHASAQPTSAGPRPAPTEPVTDTATPAFIGRLHENLQQKAVPETASPPRQSPHFQSAPEARPQDEPQSGPPGSHYVDHSQDPLEQLRNMRDMGELGKLH